MDELLGVLGWFVVDMLLMGAGRLVVRLFSLNRWRGEAWGGAEGKTHAAAGAFSFVLQGQRVITRLGLICAGAMAWLVLALSLLMTSAR